MNTYYVVVTYMGEATRVKHFDNEQEATTYFHNRQNLIILDSDFSVDFIVETNHDENLLDE